MATINLGAIKFNWKGAFNNSTAYAVDDVVSSGGNSYVCIQASQGNAVGNATAYWNIMSTKGTNGTNGTDLSSLLSTRGDLVFKNASALARLAKGTAGQVLGQGANDPAWVNGSGKTLTTQGDLLYRDGSGLQRLAKGTAAKVLAMNSAANAPEWVTAGGGCWTKLDTITLSSDVSSIEHEEANFTSTHRDYKIMLSNICVTADAQMRMRIAGDGGNLLSASNYRYAMIARKSSGSTEYQNDAGNSVFVMGGTNTGTSTNVFTTNFEINLYNPLSTASYFSFSSFGHQTDDNDYIMTHAGAGSYTENTTTAMKRFHLYMASGDFRGTGGTSTLYGRTA